MTRLLAFLASWRAVIGITVTQIRRDRFRTLLAITGIILAVTAVTLLAGTGMGVVAFGEDQLAQADRDLWLTAGPTGFTTARGGGFDNTIHNAPELADDLETHDDIRLAIPIAFDMVYVGTDPEDVTPTIAVGVRGGGPALQVTEGQQFTRGDRHYEPGHATDPPDDLEVIIDRGTAERYDITVGDTLYMGGSLAAARANEFTVVGISPTFSQFLGAPTATTHLGELHRITGTTHTQPATFVILTLHPNADPHAVQADLEAAYPEYQVRTDREQLTAVLETQATVIGGAVVLVVLGITGGIGLTTMLLTLYVHQQRRAFAALTALGISQATLTKLVFTHALLISITAGTLAILLAFPLATILNRLVTHLVGYPGLIHLTPTILAAGWLIAILIGTTSAAIAARRLARLPPLRTLA